MSGFGQAKDNLCYCLLVSSLIRFFVYSVSSLSVYLSIFSLHTYDKTMLKVGHVSS